ncbi:MAG: hypothetical protein ACFB9M_19700 [Myxococcota bacterium]
MSATLGTSSGVIAPRLVPTDLVRDLGRGRPLEAGASAAWKRLIGLDVGLEGLSQLFQPSFPGVRTFAVEGRAAPDQAFEVTLVGVSRRGVPVWTGSRAFVRGRDGSLELHRGFDQVDEEFRHRNITVDLIQRELEILESFGGGPSSRLTADAEGVGRYVCALHGFAFSDLTAEGPPVRSVRAFEPDGDRDRLRASAERLARVTAERLNLTAELKVLLTALSRAETPWDFARLTLPGMTELYTAGDDGQMGVGAFGRMLLLSEQTPPWRAALPLHAHHPDARRGAAYRRRKTTQSELRLQKELAKAIEDLNGRQRSTRVRGLKVLSAIAPNSVISQIRPLMKDPDRRVASLARATIQDMAGTYLQNKLHGYGLETSHPAAKRALAIRVLAEHFPNRLEPSAPMLRVDPDARIQKAVIPLVAAGPDAGPSLASMLAANPHFESRARPGVEALRIELIERLTVLRDPNTLPVLMAAYRRQPSPQPPEQLALSRALVVFPDPRAQTVLAEPRTPGVTPLIP